MSTPSQSKNEVSIENTEKFLDNQLDDSFAALSYLTKIKGLYEKMEKLGFYDWTKIASRLEPDLGSLKEFTRNFHKIDSLLRSEVPIFKKILKGFSIQTVDFWTNYNYKKALKADPKKEYMNFQKKLVEKLKPFNLSSNIEKLLLEFFATYTFSNAKEKLVMSRFEDFLDIYVEYMLDGNLGDLIYFPEKDRRKYKVNSFHSFFIRYNIEEEPQLILNYLEYLICTNQLAQARSLYSLKQDSLLKNVSKKVIEKKIKHLSDKPKNLNDVLTTNLNKSLLLKSLLYFNMGDLLKGFSYLSSIYIASFNVDKETAAFIKTLSLDLVKETNYPKLYFESKAEFIKEIEECFHNPCKITTKLDKEGLPEGKSNVATINSKDKNSEEYQLDEISGKEPLNKNQTPLLERLWDNSNTERVNDLLPVNQHNVHNRIVSPQRNPDSAQNDQLPNNNWNVGGLPINNGNFRDRGIPPNDNGDNRGNPNGNFGFPFDRGNPLNEIRGRGNPGNDHDFNILSMDGGGIKGIITLIFLREIEIRSGKPVYDLFQMFAGTSIGGLIALILSQKLYTAEQLLHKMMGELKNEIFEGSWCLKKCNVVFKNRVYNEENLENVLREEFTKNGTELTLDNSIGNFLITSCVVNNITGESNSHYFAKFQSNNTRGLFKSDGSPVEGFENTKLADIGRATSAAVPIFKAKEINGLSFIDGGFSHNNPSELAYFFATQSGVNTQKIHIYSIGCQGDLLGPQIPIDWTGFGALNYWQKYEKAIDNQIRVQNQAANTTCTRILGERYHRFSPGNYPKVDIDGISIKDIQILFETGMNMIRTYDQLDEVYRSCNKLLTDYNKRTNGNFLYDRRANRNRYVSRYLKYPKSYEKLNNTFAALENCTCQTYNCARCVDLKAELNNIMYYFQFIDSSKNSIPGEKMVTPFYWGLFRDTCVFCKAISIGYLRLIRLTDENWMRTHLCINSWTPFHFAASNNEINSLIFLLKDVIFTTRIQPDFDNILEFSLQKEMEAERISQQINFISDICTSKKTSYLSFFGGGYTVNEFKTDSNQEFYQFLEQLRGQLIGLTN